MLLISVDGLHASDLNQFVAANQNSTFASLMQRGTTYSAASTSQPSDSFPGLLALVTGGTPRTTGVYYHDSYSRDLWAPGSNCAGTSSDGSRAQAVPSIFGMNFQAVSVGEKLVDPALSCSLNTSGSCDPTYIPGGYVPGTFQFTPQMQTAMTYVDSAIGSMVNELASQNLLSTTEIIITAKHGQAPVDPRATAENWGPHLQPSEEGQRQGEP